MLTDAAWHHRLVKEGYLLLPAVYSRHDTEALRAELVHALERDRTGAVLSSEDGSIFGARNLSRVWPAVADAWRQGPLPEILATVLGSAFGLVRGLYFDKPADQSWALPWHRDRTIAVREHRADRSSFRKPTFKAGVAHVEAPRDVLERMLTLRLHLDDVTEENGPLKVMSGSHRDETSNEAIVTILADMGDVLLMRPLLSHCSNKSLPGTRRQRRVLHLEFTADPELPDGFAWHEYHAGSV